MDSKHNWHGAGISEVFQSLSSGCHGLTQEQARQRLTQYGSDELKDKAKTPPVPVFLQQFPSPLIYVLLIAAIISVIVGHFMDAGVIPGMLLLNAVVGFVQEILI